MKESEVERVAFLARLKLERDEAQKMGQQLTTVIENFEKIRAINTEGVEPLVTPTDMEVVYREDVVTEFSSLAEAFEQAPEKMGKLYKVPPVV